MFVYPYFVLCVCVRERETCARVHAHSSVQVARY